MQTEVQLSIVTSLYRSERFIREFHEQCRRIADEMRMNCEIIFVNDASPDDSLNMAIEICSTDPGVKVIDLSRNFGHHLALMTGFAHAAGQLVYVTDVDLEQPIEFLRLCRQRIAKGDCDVVYGYQEKRSGSWLERFTGTIFWSIINALSSTHVPPNLVTSRLMTKRYVASLLQHREREPFLAGLWALTGYKQVGLPIVKSPSGFSSYNVLKRVKQAVTSVTSFSSRPLLLSALIGLGICTVALIAIAYLVVGWMLWGNSIEGWTSLIIAVCLMGGANLFFVGIVGLYISKIFIEVKQRPYSIVRDIYSGGLGDTQSGLRTSGGAFGNDQ